MVTPLAGLAALEIFLPMFLLALPAGVRLQLTLPEGTLLRDVMLATGA